MHSAFYSILFSRQFRYRSCNRPLPVCNKWIPSPIIISFTLQESSIVHSCLKLLQSSNWDPRTFRYHNTLSTTCRVFVSSDVKRRQHHAFMTTCRTTIFFQLGIKFQLLLSPDFIQSNLTKNVLKHIIILCHSSPRLLLL